VRLSCTVFTILSHVFQTLKRSRDNDDAHFRDSLSSVICRLGLVIFTHIPNLKCLRLTATKMKGHAKCTLVLSHPLGELRGNEQGSSMARWKAMKFGIITRFDLFEVSDRWKFEISKIQGGSGRHLEKSKNRHISAAVGAISTTFGTVMQFDLLDRSDS